MKQIIQNLVVFFWKKICFFQKKERNMKSARLTDLKENFSTHKERILHVPSSVESKTTLECTGGKSFWRWSTYQSHRKRWRPRRSLWCSSGSGCGSALARPCPRVAAGLSGPRGLRGQPRLTRRRRTHRLAEEVDADRRLVCGVERAVPARRISA